MKSVDFDKMMIFFTFIFALALLTSRAGINIGVIASSLIFILIFIKQPFRITAEPTIDKSIIAFFLISLFLSLFSQDIFTSLNGIIRLLIAFLPFYYTIYALRNRNFSNIVVILIAISAIIGSCVTIWQGLHGMTRARGLLGIMDLAGIIGLVIPFLLVQTIEFPTKSKYVRSFFAISLFLSLFALLYNGTRGVWISTAVTIGTYIAFNITKSRRLLYGTIAGILVICVFLTMNPVAIDRAASITRTSADTSIMERLEMWRFAWNTFLDHPITGVGFRTLHFYFTPDVKLVLTDDKSIGSSHVHNIFLQSLAEGGIIGLGALLGMFGTILWVSWKKSSGDSGRWGWVALLCTIHFLIHGFFDYTFNASTELYAYWFFIGLAVVNLVPVTVSPIASQRRATILMYHNIAHPPKGARLRGLYATPLMFRFQMWYLRVAGFRVVGLDEIVSFTKEDSLGASRDKLVSLTFDDGFADFYHNAWPILKEYGYPATVYLVADRVGEYNTWDADKLNVKKPLMDWAMITELSHNGITFGSHTRTHLHLGEATDEQAQEEIYESKALLESKLACPLEHFCYPYGNHNVRTPEFVRQAGYTTATTTLRGFVFPGDNAFTLKRVPIAYRTYPCSFIHKLHSDYEMRKS